MQTSEAILSVKNLTKEFRSGKKRVIAVDHVNFDINPNEIVSFVGQSGSGKTTTGRMLLNLLKPSSGEIRFEGENITQFKRTEQLEYWRKVQGVFQDPFSSFNQFFSIKGNLKRVFKLIKRKIPEKQKEELIKHALELVNVDANEVIDKFPFELSGGQRQRVMLARIFLIKPRVLIADEPTSMIDATLRSGILRLLMKLREDEGMTILFITHDMGLAYYVSDRIFVMHEGKIVEKGSAEKVIFSPSHSYTKKLISDVPVLNKKWL